MDRGATRKHAKRRRWAADAPGRKSAFLRMQGPERQAGLGTGRAQQRASSSRVLSLAAATSGGSCSRASMAAAEAVAAGPSSPPSRTQRPASPVSTALPSSCCTAAGMSKLPARLARDTVGRLGRAAMSREALVRRGGAGGSRAGLPLRDRAETSREALLPFLAARRLAASPGAPVWGGGMPYRADALPGPSPVPAKLPLGPAGTSMGKLPP